MTLEPHCENELNSLRSTGVQSAFVEIDKGIEGLVHVSEMSWNKKNTNPFKLVTSGNEVDVISVNLIRFNAHGKVVEMSFGGNTHEVVAAYGDSL